MTNPDDVSVSRSEAGSIADQPDDPTEIKVTNEEDYSVGFMQKWDTGEWIFGDVQAVRWLRWKRWDEYNDNE